MEHFIPRYKELICGVSFGCNAGEHNNTCSAVAATIVLNYLAAMYDERLVPAQFRLEARGSLHCCAQGSHAERFHHYLLDECGFAPKYHLGHLTWGVWGARLKKGIDCYFKKLPSLLEPALVKSVHSEEPEHSKDSPSPKEPVPSSELPSPKESVLPSKSPSPKEPFQNSLDPSKKIQSAVPLLNFSWRIGGIKRILASIDAGLPALITTRVGIVRDCDGVSGYSWHTMVVYGYRTTGAGSIELAVHSGWDTSYVERQAGTYVQKDIWLSSKAVFISYWFELLS